METKNILTEELINEAEELAKKYFRQGLNCAESVFQAALDLNETSLPKEVVGLASGFGGGMGHTKNTCGAITGAVLAVGLAKGRENPMEKETPAEQAAEKKEVYKPFAEMIREIEEKYGTLICKELSDPHGDFEGKARRKNCMEITGYCAGLAQKYMLE